jgi:hypothetical protein
MNAWEPLPETRCPLPWELQQVLVLLGFTDELEDDYEIAAREVALTGKEPHAAWARGGGLGRT